MPPDSLVASALCVEVLKYTSGLMPHSAIVHNLTMSVVCGVCVGVHVCVCVCVFKENVGGYKCI